MELRPRGQGQTAAAKRAVTATKPTRKTRRKPNVSNEMDAPTTTQAAGSSSSNSGLHDRGPHPRRGAPSGNEFDVSSVRGPGSDEDDYTSPDPSGTREMVQEPRAQSSEPHELAAGPAVGCQQPNSLSLMEKRLSPLSTAADEMTKCLETSDSDGLYEAHRAFFRTLCSSYPSLSATSPFVEWHSLGDVGVRMATVMAKANLVTALDEIYRERSRASSVQQRVMFLKALDAASPDLFVAPGRAPMPPDLTLDIRTHLFIEFLAANNGRSNPEAIVIRTFCEENASAEFSSIKGPYRSLGGHEEEFCSERIAQIMDNIREGHELDGDAGLTRLREKFPIEELAERFSHWVVEELRHLRAVLGPATMDEQVAQADSDGESGAAESQEIIRSENEPSLYTEARCIEVLRRCEHMDKDDDDDEPSDGDFEVDGRKEGNQPPPSWSRRRLRSTSASASASASASSPRVSQSSRRWARQGSTSYTRRVKWTDHDTNLLNQCIKERRANYAIIERYDNDKFEHPRNQQAYRDKARNLKVDYLRTDSPLPECYDLVSLGPKEVRQIQSNGKNPLRREADVDENGKPTNTRLVF
ncbi:hypothetical protein XA68_15951 [Ophiocordyceps unilateralis]|uniref:Myb-like domain-containing protein n=1 Tax=Ophiocordyceps unilateralis TaxID=268505 RepID=A0A2A9P7L5_OPHUN|nr:hypothetical protein XA68_15951 [Ophiocordyceps unilateralis]